MATVWFLECKIEMSLSYYWHVQVIFLKISKLLNSIFLRVKTIPQFSQFAHFETVSNIFTLQALKISS